MARHRPANQSSYARSDCAILSSERPLRKARIPLNTLFKEAVAFGASRRLTRGTNSAVTRELVALPPHMRFDASDPNQTPLGNMSPYVLACWGATWDGARRISPRVIPGEIIWFAGPS